MSVQRCTRARNGGDAIQMRVIATPGLYQHDCVQKDFAANFEDLALTHRSFSPGVKTDSQTRRPSGTKSNRRCLSSTDNTQVHLQRPVRDLVSHRRTGSSESLIRTTKMVLPVREDFQHHARWQPGSSVRQGRDGCRVSRSPSHRLPPRSSFKTARRSSVRLRGNPNWRPPRSRLNRDLHQSDGCSKSGRNVRR